MAMNTSSSGIAFRLGRVVRGYCRVENRLARWGADSGVPMGLGRALLWVIKLAVFGILCLAALWLAILMAMAFAASIFASMNGPLAGDEDREDHREDHRQSPFYDPIIHNDDPDPRFEGEESR